MKHTHGTLNLIFRRHREGRTFLAGQHCRLPLQVLTPYYSDGDGTAFVYLLNPSGGILQGDLLETDILVEQDARAWVATPSANKFYRMDEGHATLQNRIRVQQGGVLEYMPEYNIPFAQSSVVQETTFDLDPDATLLAFDMIVPGRIEKGELFAYNLYSSRTSIRVNGRLEARESAKLEPARHFPGALGVLEGHRIYGTVFLYQKNLPQDLKTEVDLYFSRQTGLSGGMTFLSDDLATVKFLGDSVQECQDAVQAIWALARPALLGKEPVRIRKY
jgi:urease accessory protein